MKILLNLFHRPLGTGETVRLASLAEALDLDIDVVTAQLRDECGVHIHQDKAGAYIFTPNTQTLKDKLVEDGFDADVLQPRKALRDGRMCLVKWIEKFEGPPKPLRLQGCVDFKVTWEGKASPSVVCCHALNAASRYYVRACIVAGSS